MAGAKVNEFVLRWFNHGDEKSEMQNFWREFFRDILNIERPEELIEFEKRVELKHKSFIDVYIPSTRVIIEQKSFDIDLDKDKSVKQSDGEFLTPFEQAKRYSDWLPDSQRARWIITCNFQEFHIHDMETPKAPPEIIFLKDLEAEAKAKKFDFLVDVKAKAPKEIREVEISIKAGELVGKLYDSLKVRYQNPDSKDSLRSLNILCVRVVFLLYAEDSDLFSKSQFHDYLKKQSNPRRALIDLFEVLSQEIDQRDPYLDDDLKNFPYVNGGLFEEKNIEIPQLDGETLEIILREMSESFDWSSISPTIFGAVFESTLNPETRRSGGMHYTSIENIHKVIDPLFLEDLRLELENIFAASKGGARTRKLKEFQKKLSSLKFLDPACGSGNFLTETYLCLRRLENKILTELMKQQINFASGDLSPIQVKISQFFGIEINDFAVAVAKTALWIAESQMWNETQKIVQNLDDFLPLKSFNNIIEANALKIDWANVINSGELNFIMGNPPFIGASMMTKEQKDEAVAIFGKVPRANSIDYVGAWYHKAAKFIHGTDIKVAFVSTNSITQGEQVAPLWKKLFEDFKIHFDFAWRTFKWSSEANEKAHVHCVIIGFSQLENDSGKVIFDGGIENKIEARNINAYLVDAPDVFIEARGKPLCDVPIITNGNKPSDGGNLILTPEEREELISKDPKIAQCVRRYVGAKDFIRNDEVRYCLWLKDVPANVYSHNREIMRRLEAVRAMRAASTAAPTRAAAEWPYKFFSTPQPDAPCLCIPRVSSERRKYIPMAFLRENEIAGDSLSIVHGAELYHFGILTSSVHMVWVRTVAGRLETRYRYSGDSVYNPFVWPTVNEKQKSKIESTAKKILEAREKFPDSSLADLYDPLTMPDELLKAHKANDSAVCEAYGFDKNISEEEIVSALMSFYEKFSKLKKEE